MQIDKIYAIPRWDGSTPILFFPLTKCRNSLIEGCSFDCENFYADMDFFNSCQPDPPNARARERMGELITGLVQQLYNNQRLLITYKDRAKYRKARWGCE